MSTNNIDDQLKEEVDNYKLQCFKICKEMADQNIDKIQKAYNELYNRIDDGIKSNISRSIGTKDLYNYNDVPEYKFYSYKNDRNSKIETTICRDGNKISFIENNQVYGISDKKEISFMEFFMDKRGAQSVYKKCSCNSQSGYYGQIVACHATNASYSGLRLCDGCICTKAIDGFSQFIKGEKIICMAEKIINSMQQSSCNKTLYTLITNYGRYIRFNIGNYINQCRDMEFIHESTAENCYRATLENVYKEYNFWIPTDYIRLINLLKPIQIEGNVLDFIKNIMYDRKLIPLYAQDVVKENDELKKQYDDYKKKVEKLEREKNLFENEKNKFYSDEKPVIDMIKDKKEVSELKDKLQLMAKKIKLEKEQIEKDRKAIENINLEGFEM